MLEGREAYIIEYFRLNVDYLRIASTRLSSSQAGRSILINAGA